MVYCNQNLGFLFISGATVYCGKKNRIVCPFATISEVCHYIVYLLADIPALSEAAKGVKGVTVEVMDDPLLKAQYAALNSHEGVPYPLLGVIPPDSEEYYLEMGSFQFRMRNHLRWFPTSAFLPQGRVWVLYQFSVVEGGGIRISLEGGGIFAEDALNQWMSKG